jgi:surface protein
VDNPYRSHTLLRHDLHSQFYDCSRFESDLAGWDVSSVVDMSSMVRWEQVLRFLCAIHADCQANSFSVSCSQFYGATSFQSDVSAWKVDSVEDISSMFERASSFSANLFSWGDRIKASSLAVNDLFIDSGCPNVRSPDPYDLTLGPWCYSFA